MKIVMVTDIVSPFCWIVAKHLDRAMENFPELSFDVELQPFKVTPDLPDNGITFLQYQQQHMTPNFGSMVIVSNVLKQVQQFGLQTDCHFRFDRLTHWPNTTKAHGLWLMADKSHQWELHKALCCAHFELGLNLGDIKVLAKLGSEFELESSAIQEKLADSQYLQHVEKLISRPYGRGIHSVPHTLINNAIEIKGAKDVNHIILQIKRASTYSSSTVN